MLSASDTCIISRVLEYNGKISEFNDILGGKRAVKTLVQHIGAENLQKRVYTIPSCTSD